METYIGRVAPSGSRPSVRYYRKRHGDDRLTAQTAPRRGRPLGFALSRRERGQTRLTEQSPILRRPRHSPHSSPVDPAPSDRPPSAKTIRYWLDERTRRHRGVSSRLPAASLSVSPFLSVRDGRKTVYDTAYSRVSSNTFAVDEQCPSVDIDVYLVHERRDTLFTRRFRYEAGQTVSNRRYWTAHRRSLSGGRNAAPVRRSSRDQPPLPPRRAFVRASFASTPSDPSS